jgi:hypothetical protein
MWPPSKNPDDYLRGQPGNPPSPGSGKRPPFLLSVGTYLGVWAVATLLASALGADWDRSVMPIGFSAGLAAQVALALWWRSSARSGRHSEKLPTRRG